jgi:5S rRNA maturation endonuclease (ribonuclease M5)
VKPLTILPLYLITDFVDYCNSIQESTIIIVEGKRDILALKAIGIDLIDGRIFARKGYSLNDLIDEIVSTPVIIILVDFDQEGKRLRNAIKHEIQHRKGHGYVDPLPRQLLYKFFRAARINEIEELKQFIQ